MTEYDYSPEAFERHLATQRRITRWVDQTERHRNEFSSGSTLAPPVPSTSAGLDDYFASPPRKRPSYSNHRRHSSANYPLQQKYASPPVSPPYTMAGPVSYPIPPPVMVVSPQRSQTQKSRRLSKSHRSSATYIVTPPPPQPVNTAPYYYPYASAPGYTYVTHVQPGQPPVPPLAPNTSPQTIPYYNSHPSQPLRIAPFPHAANPNIESLKQLHSGQNGTLTYSYSAPVAFASSANTPPPHSGSSSQYVPPHMLYQRLHEIERNHDSRKSRSSSSHSDRGRSSSRDGGRSRSRGRSRTRKSWWHFT